MENSNFKKISKGNDMVWFDISNLKIKDTLSYSRIDTFSQCQYKYWLKYEQKNYSQATSLALELGTLCHRAMEMKYQKENMEDILKEFYEGFTDESNRFNNGLNELKEKYYNEFYIINEKNNMSYEDKVKVFLDRLKNKQFDNEWECIGTEVDFSIAYKDYAIIKGFIDRVDRNKLTGEIRVVDYKTNNMPFDHKDLTTPLQMYIYSLACKELYDQLPNTCEYDLLFHNEIQQGGTKGFLKRGEKKLDKLLDGIAELKIKGEEYYKPSATPLCHWCDYCTTNKDADDWMSILCDYYCLWTKEDKCFEKNKVWEKPVDNEDDDWGDDEW